MGGRRREGNEDREREGGITSIRRLALYALLLFFCQAILGRLGGVPPYSGTTTVLTIYIFISQTREEDLQANAGKEQEAASQTTATKRPLRTHYNVDEIIVCSFVEGGAVNLVATESTSVSTAAGSRVGFRVPPVSVIFIIWLLPATVLNARGFRWQDGVKGIHFGDVRYPPGSFFETFEVPSFVRCSNKPLERSGVPWPSGLKRIRFGLRFYTAPKLARLCRIFSLPVTL